jgi:hypothetical protein
MAKGDTINSTSASTSINFQPASGVEVMITFISGLSGTQAGLTDGTTESKCYIAREVSNTRTTTYPWAYGYSFAQSNVRIPVTNSNYLTVTNTTNAGYSGIQIK